MQNTVEFLRRIYGGFDHEGTFTIIHILKWDFGDFGDEYPEGFKKKKRADVRVFRYPLSDLEGDFDWGPHLDANSRCNDIYFGAALRSSEFLNTPTKKKSARGVATDCSLSTCLAFDIDFETPGAHKSDKLPKDLEEAAHIIDLGPAPSIIVNSGYGVHCYWIYNENKILDGSKKGSKEYDALRKRAHAPYMRAMKDAGWHGDPTYTVDRIWRLPGFQNWKIPTSPRATTVLYGLDGDVEKHDLDKLAPPAKKSDKATFKQSGIFKKSSIPVPKAECVQGLEKSLKAYADKYYEDSLEAGESEIEEDQEASVELKQKSDFIKRMLAGESIEEKGNRDFALTKVCGIISYLTSDIEEYTDADLEYIVTDLMGSSLQAWVDDSEEDTDLEREMEKTIDKLQRIKAKDQENQVAGLKNLAKALRRDRRRAGSFLESPPEEEVSGDVGEEEEEEELDKADMLRCGLIIHGDFTYVWDWPNGCYYGRHTKSARDLKSVIRDCWPESDDSCPFKHSFIDEESKAVEIAPAHLERIYSRAAEHSYYSFCVDQTCFDNDKRELIINNAPIRYHESRFDSDIDDWLLLLGGRLHYETLCKWLAGLNHLDKPCAALYLDGPPGCGKSLFGLGATQLWSDDVPLYESIAGNFNQTLLASPVNLIDEGIASDTKNASMVMRRLIAQGSHLVNVKHGPQLRLRSHLRFVIAANNDEVLLSGKEEKLSKDDARALSERIIYIKIKNDRARDMFAELNKGNVLTNKWIKGGAFARHVLWLGENIDLSSTGRFLVEGSSSEMRDKVLFQGDERNLVLEWITLFCEAPARIQARTIKGLFAAEIGNGFVAINTKLMKGRWSEFSGEKSLIHHSHLLRHIKALAINQVKVWTEKGSARYWVIPIALILLYSETHDIGDTDRIEEFSQRDTDITQRIEASRQRNSKSDI